jgi:hypothetical protein
VPIAPPYHPAVVPEAELKQTEAGLVPASVGWFVMNARDGRWFHRPGRDSLPLTGSDEFEAETYFPILAMSIQVLAPGERLQRLDRFAQVVERTKGDR